MHARHLCLLRVSPSGLASNVLPLCTSQRKKSCTSINSALLILYTYYIYTTRFWVLVNNFRFATHRQTSFSAPHPRISNSIMMKLHVKAACGKTDIEDIPESTPKASLPYLFLAGVGNFLTLFSSSSLLVIVWNSKTAIIAVLIISQREFPPLEHNVTYKGKLIVFLNWPAGSVHAPSMLRHHK